MTIRNPDRYMEGIWDWGILNGCFGDTRISPSDMDGYVERNGFFLCLEAKGPGVPIPLGQALDFKALQKTGLWTIVIVWGERNKPERARVMGNHGTREGSCDVTKFRAIVDAWYRWANNQRPRRSGGVNDSRS